MGLTPVSADTVFTVRFGPPSEKAELIFWQQTPLIGTYRSRGSDSSEISLVAGSTRTSISVSERDGPFGPYCVR